MKKISIVVFASLCTLVGFSQSIFDKYEDMDAVGSVIINKSLIELATDITAMSDDKEAREFVELAQGLQGVKVFMTESASVSQDMAKTVGRYLKSAKLEELMRVKDDGVNIKFYVREGRKKDHVTELLMFVSGIKEMEVGPKGRPIETILVSLTGDMDLKKIGALTCQMDLPKELNKVNKG